MDNRHQGFTLIELVMVIVILGILAAMAVPRFVDLGKDARVATLKGVEAALQSAWNMAHAMQLAQGKSANESITVNGVTIAMNSGYPTTSAIGSLMDTQGFDTTTAGTFRIRTSCEVVYNPPNGAGSPPTTTPSTTRTESGC